MSRLLQSFILNFFNILYIVWILTIFYLLHQFLFLNISIFFYIIPYPWHWVIPPIFPILDILIICKFKLEVSLPEFRVPHVFSTALLAANRVPWGFSVELNEHLWMANPWYRSTFASNNFLIWKHYWLFVDLVNCIWSLHYFTQCVLLMIIG